MKFYNRKYTDFKEALDKLSAICVFDDTESVVSYFKDEIAVIQFRWYGKGGEVEFFIQDSKNPDILLFNIFHDEKVRKIKHLEMNNIRQALEALDCGKGIFSVKYKKCFELDSCKVIFEDFIIPKNVYFVEIEGPNDDMIQSTARKLKLL